MRKNINDGLNEFDGMITHLISPLHTIEEVIRSSQLKYNHRLYYLYNIYSSSIPVSLSMKEMNTLNTKLDTNN